MPIPLIVAVIALVAAAAWRVASARAAAATEESIKGGQAGQCRELRDQLARARVQGKSVEDAQKIEAALRQCEAEMERLGLDVDRWAGAMEEIQGLRQKIDQEWGHYRSTDTADAVKRNNTRNTIKRSADELMRKLRATLGIASSAAELDQLQSAALGVAADAFARARCFELSESGCGRMALNEPDWDERARDEYLGLVVPIVGAVEVLINGKLSALPRWDLIGHGTATEPLGTRLFNEKKDKLRGATLTAARDHLLGAIDKRRGELQAARFRVGSSGNFAARLGGPLAFGGAK